TSSSTTSSERRRSAWCSTGSNSVFPAGNGSLSPGERDTTRLDPADIGNDLYRDAVGPETRPAPHADFAFGVADAHLEGALVSPSPARPDRLRRPGPLRRRSDTP